MSLTPNYGFNIPTGADAVNLLTQNYPNFTSLDSILKTIELTGTTTATVTKVGTVFQLVRTNSALNVIRFVATGNYVAGDTFTIDGVAVTATSVQGTSLQTGAFVINQSVMCILNQSVLTVLVGGSGSNDAADIDYDNTGSGLAATNVQAAIDELKNDIPTSLPASDITYDNSLSGLVASNAQEAIDEINSKAGINFSTNEHAIGTWIDGRILYEKTYVVPSTAYSPNVNVNVDLDSALVGTTLEMIGTIIDGTNRHFTLSHYAGATEYARAYTTSNDTLLRVAFISSVAGNLTGYVTRRYVK